MKFTLNIIFVFLIIASSNLYANSTHNNQDKCLTVLENFFKVYDGIVKTNSSEKIANLIDDDSKRWGLNKSGIVARISKFISAIEKYEGTVNQCETINEKTISWNGYVDLGITIRPHPEGTKLIRIGNNWRIRMIEYRP